MTEMPSDFWSGWIITLTVGSLIGFTWVIVSAYFSKDQKAVPGDVEQQSSMVWDENLREGASAPPMWWFWLMLGSLVITVAYLMLYPGLGSFSGAFQWSQGGQLTERLDRYDAEFGEHRSSVLQLSLVDIQADEALMNVAEKIYDRHCGACHGVNREGQANRFPNLRDEEWIWGGSAEAIESSIRKGRNAIMAGWGETLDNNQLNDITDFVLALGRGESVEEHRAKPIYDSICIACHLADGTGQTALGAPNLTNSIYLYGSDAASVKYTIAIGREGTMPAFDNLLDDTQIRLLVALLWR